MKRCNERKRRTAGSHRAQSPRLERVQRQYQALHGDALTVAGEAWGVWARTERELGILGDVRGRDVLELGCGAAQWSIALARRGARVVAMDLSERQLAHARRRASECDAAITFLEASAENVPLPAQSLDIVFCDHGATSFADPRRVLPEVARLLRPGGLFAFNCTSVIAEMCRDAAGRLTPSLQRDYFGIGMLDGDDIVDFTLPYGEYIALFRTSGFEIEGLEELRPAADATTTYTRYADRAWARRWPLENIWRLRRADDR